MALDDTELKRVQHALAEMWELLTETHKERPQALATALHGASFKTLDALIWGSQRADDTKDHKLPFPMWPTLAPTVLDACRLDPALMLPQLGVLITQEAGAVRKEKKAQFVYEFNSVRARILFGDEAPVLSLFEQPIVVEPNAQAMVDAVRAAALARRNGTQPTDEVNS